MKARTAGAIASGLAFVVACARGGLVGAPGDPASPKTAVAASDAPDRAPRFVEPTRYLRQLSLDLRGAPPSIDELEAVAKEGHVDDARIDAMLRAPAFLDRVRAWHRAILWPTIANYAIGVRPITVVYAGGRPFTPASLRAHPEDAPKLAAWLDDALDRGRNDKMCDFAIEYPPPRDRGAQPTYEVTGTDGVKRAYPYYDARGVPLPYHDAKHCPNYCANADDATRAPQKWDEDHPSGYAWMGADGADAHPHELDPPGKHCPASHPFRVINACGNERLGRPNEAFVAKRLDGWRPMVHYWSQGKSVRTCAFEAQTRAASLADGKPCWDSDDPSCGCGPDGAYCMPQQGHDAPTIEEVRGAIDEEPLEIVASVVDRDEDYFDALTTRRSFVTGALAYYFRHQAGVAAKTDIASPVPPDALPEASFDDPAWREYVRGPEHSGVLTTAAYLLRFPTWRSRVSQFRTQYMCRPFTPVFSSMPGPDDPCTREPNLAKRCGCRNCHVAIEPMGAWFGRWAERGARYLDPATFPVHDATCEACFGDPGCLSRCRAYLSDALDAESARFAGMLRAYAFRSEEEERRIDEGPRGLVETAIATGELTACTVRTAWRELLGREATDDETRARLPAIARDFEAHHRSYRALLRAIVTSDEYRSGE